MGQLFSGTHELEVDPYNTIRILEAQVAQHRNDLAQMRYAYSQMSYAEYQMRTYRGDAILAKTRTIQLLQSRLAECHRTIAQHIGSYTVCVQPGTAAPTVVAPGAPGTDVV